MSSRSLLFVLALVVGCTEGPEGPGGDGGTGGGGTGGGPFQWPPDATAYFDQYGILNADCETDEDCAMVLGYYHAADRFVQMDLRRRLATGRLTEIFDRSIALLGGLPALDADSRALYSTREGTPIEDQVVAGLSAEALALLAAYATGVNQWIADVRAGRNGALFPRELASLPLVYGPSAIPKWTIEDSVATVLPLIDQLSHRLAVDVEAGAAREAINDDEKFSDLWSRRPRVESSILPPGWTPPTEGPARSEAARKKNASWRDSLDVRAALSRLSVHTKQNGLHRRSTGAGFRSGEGSNSWVIAPSRSVSGNAMMAVDAHLAMSQPAIFYLAHLDAVTNGNGEIHSAGVTLAGLPWVTAGQNGHIAWGSTTAFMDLTDWYVEELVTDDDGNPAGVMFEGREVQFTRVPFPVSFSDGTQEERELLFVPHHGPVREIDLENEVAITLRWTAQDMTTDGNLFDDIVRARSLEEARVALTNSTSVSQCWVVADSEGDIGYFPYARPPKRTWATNLDGNAPPWLPLDGRCSTPETCYEWTDWYEYTELPQVVNPEQGYVATANNDMTGSLFDGDPTNDGYPPLQTDVRPGFRHGRIVEMIENIGSNHSPETSRDMQGDTHSLIGERLVPGLIAIAESEMTTLTERAQKVLSSLKAWRFTCPTGVDGPYVDSPLTDDPDELREASGCAAFHAALYGSCRPKELRKSYARVESFAYYYSIVDPTQLLLGDAYWDDSDTPEVETKYETIAECFDDAAKLLIDDLRLGDDETKWVWGRAHRLVLTSDLSAFGLSIFDSPPPGDTPFANEGGLWTVNVTDPGLDARGFFQVQGAGIRLVCETPSSGPTCTVQLPGGQSGHVESDNYDDLIFKYLENEPIELVFDIEKAKTSAVRTVTFD